MADTPPFSVLVIDDDALMLRATARALRGVDMEVVAVLSAEEALVQLATRSFNAVLSDWNLKPPERGDRLLAEVAARQPGLRLVLYSSHEFDTRAMPYPVLRKPVDLVDLENALRGRR